MHQVQIAMISIVPKLIKFYTYFQINEVLISSSQINQIMIAVLRLN
jgi:hypothetical protein